MEEKQKRLKAKVLHKHELEVDWLKSTKYIPEKGELVVYDAEVDKEGNVLELPEGRETPYTYPRMKLGDGVHNINELEFSGGAENMVLFGDGELVPDEPVQPEEKGQLTYELSADGTYYIVTGKGTVKGTEIVIPDTYEGKPVKHIKDNAFLSNPEITSFTVGRNVEYIGYNNLDIMTNLTELYFVCDFTREELAERKLWPPEYIDPEYPFSSLFAAWCFNGWINTIDVLTISDTQLDIHISANINYAETYKSALAEFFAAAVGTEPSFTFIYMYN